MVESLFVFWIFKTPFSFDLNLFRGFEYQKIRIMILNIKNYLLKINFQEVWPST